MTELPWIQKVVLLAGVFSAAVALFRGELVWGFVYALITVAAAFLYVRVQP